MEYGCKNRVVVITGGTSGIGLAAARAFWLDGAAVNIVGRDSTRYHVSPACHYISNEIHRIPKGSIAGLRNDAGRSYRPCRICGGEPASEYYVLPAGETYHTRADCSSLSYYVRQVPLSEAEHLGPCSYCAGGHG